MQYKLYNKMESTQDQSSLPVPYTKQIVTGNHRTRRSQPKFFSQTKRDINTINQKIDSRSTTAFNNVGTTHVLPYFKETIDWKTEVHPVKVYHPVLPYKYDG